MPRGVPIFRLFKYTETDDVIGAEFGLDEAYGTRPTRAIGHGSDTGRPGHLVVGLVERVHFRFNSTNAGLTYRLTLYRSDAGATNSMQLEGDKIWDSDEAWPGGCAQDTEYDASGLIKPFWVDSIGNMNYGIDWSAASGCDGGFLEISGRRRSDDA